MYKVSVLIPIYNVEKYLKQCLDSVLNQTLNDIEIICVNDGSTDKSREILDDYDNRYPQMKVIHKGNSGYGHTMNTALKAASGEYVGIVESDDFADCNMFEYLYSQVQSEKLDIVKSNYWKHEYGKDTFVEVLNTFSYGTVFCPRSENVAMFHSLQTIWSAIYRREFLIANNIWFNETKGASYQDVSFVFKALACAERVVFVKNAFLHYRMDNPASSVKSREKVYCIFEEIVNIEKYLESRSDIKKQCLRILIPLKLRLFKENFIRVAASYKMSFLRRAIAELKKSAEYGDVKREYWGEAMWQEMQKILSDSDAFVFKVYKDILRNQLLYNGLYDRLAKASEVYLYGAGKIARQVISRLNGVTVKACLVSSMGDNVEQLFGVPVIEYDSEKLDRSDAIIIAIGLRGQYDIFSMLDSAGFENIIPLDREMRSCLEIF